MIPILTAMFIYSLIHSVLAGNKVKQSIRSKIGFRAYEGLYRFSYNILATISFVPILLLITLSDSKTVWQFTSSWNTPLSIIRAIGLIGFCIALLQTDLARFAGLSQVLAYLRNRPLPLPPEKLRTTGLYSRSRHPLYIFSVLILWTTPVMTNTYFAFCISVTIYFIIGSHYEELRMLNTFGEAYARYQTQVPWLFALPCRRKNN